MKNNLHHLKGRGRQGFTLIETVIALSMIAMLMGMVFTVKKGVLQLGDSTVEVLEASRREAKVENYLRNLLSDLALDTKISLTEEDDERSLELTETSSFFPSQGTEHRAKWVRLYEEADRDGLRRLVLEMGTKEEEDGGRDEGIIGTYILKESLSYVRWECFDSQSNEWIEEWSEEMNPPSHLRLIYKEADLDSEQITLFCLPQREPVRLNQQRSAPSGP